MDAARKHDWDAKVERQLVVNNSKYKKRSQVKVGDWVLIRNFTKRSKFDPCFQPEPCKVTEVSDGWIALERAGTHYRRHLDDIKFIPDYQPVSHPPSNPPSDMLTAQQLQCEFPFNGDYDENSAYQSPLLHEANTSRDQSTGQRIPRRSARIQQQQQGSPAREGQPIADVQTTQQQEQREKSPAHSEPTLSYAQKLQQKSDCSAATTPGDRPQVQQQGQLQESSTCENARNESSAPIAPIVQKQKKQRGRPRKAIQVQQSLRILRGGKEH